MSAKSTGGPAFPQSEQVTNSLHADYGLDGGMTLRDYFAAKVLHGVIANSKFKQSSTFDVVAEECYRMADAMLLERAK